MARTRARQLLSRERRKRSGGVLPLPLLLPVLLWLGLLWVRLGVGVLLLLLLGVVGVVGLWSRVWLWELSVMWGLSVMWLSALMALSKDGEGMTVSAAKVTGGSFCE
jgi:hypothetical protein